MNREIKSRTAAPKRDEERKMRKERVEKKDVVIMKNACEVYDKQTIISAYDK